MGIEIEMEKKKLTDEEIVNALEVCMRGKGCEDCPYFENGIDCLRRSEKNTLDLIHRQKAEIERLTEERDVYLDDCSAVRHKIRQEIEEKFELQKQVDELNKKLIARESVFHNLVIVEKDKSVKATAKEIFILAEDYNCGYETDMDNFMKELKERYGVEVE